jgi:hypothetical protein
MDSERLFPPRLYPQKPPMTAKTIMPIMRKINSVLMQITPCVQKKNNGEYNSMAEKASQRINRFSYKVVIIFSLELINLDFN